MFAVMYDKSSNRFYVGEGESNYTDGSEAESKDYIQKMTDIESKNISDGYMIVGKCKKCGKYFPINDSMLIWMKKKDFDGFPKKCQFCKKKKP